MFEKRFFLKVSRVKIEPLINHRSWEGSLTQRTV